MIILETERLIVRTYKDSDIEPFYEMCSDPAVMRFFPKLLSKEESQAAIDRFEASQKDNGYAFWALESKEDGQFVGFTGLNSPPFDADFTPCVEIGWRLRSDYHGRGYATEAARACLHYGFHHLELDEIVSFAPVVNQPSIHVMKKIGMRFANEFDFDLLVDYPNIQRCALYRKSKND